MSSSSGIKGLEAAWENLHLDEEDDGGLEVVVEEIRKTASDGKDL